MKSHSGSVQSMMSVRISGDGGNRRVAQRPPPPRSLTKTTTYDPSRRLIYPSSTSRTPAPCRNLHHGTELAATQRPHRPPFAKSASEQVGIVQHRHSQSSLLTAPHRPFHISVQEYSSLYLASVSHAAIGEAESVGKSKGGGKAFR